jgi:hypothetical protein
MSGRICDKGEPREQGGGEEDAANQSGMVCNRTLPRCLSQSMILVNIHALILIK